MKAQSWRDLPPHRDENQVELDVNRSFIYYPKSTLVLLLFLAIFLTLDQMSPMKLLVSGNDNCQT